MVESRFQINGVRVRERIKQTKRMKEPKQTKVRTRLLSYLFYKVLNITLRFLVFVLVYVFAEKKNHFSCVHLIISTVHIHAFIHLFTTFDWFLSLFHKIYWCWIQFQYALCRKYISNQSRHSKIPLINFITLKELNFISSFIPPLMILSLSPFSLFIWCSLVTHSQASSRLVKCLLVSSKKKVKKRARKKTIKWQAWNYWIGHIVFDLIFFLSVFVRAHCLR